MTRRHNPFLAEQLISVGLFMVMLFAGERAWMIAWFIIAEVWFAAAKVVEELQKVRAE